MICQNLSADQTISNQRVLRNDQIIKEGAITPFTGVLVDEPSYRYYVDMRDRALILDKQCTDCNCDPILSFVMGAVVMSLVVYGVGHH